MLCNFISEMDIEFAPIEMISIITQVLSVDEELSEEVHREIIQNENHLKVLNYQSIYFWKRQKIEIKCQWIRNKCGTFDRYLQCFFEWEQLK